ncbi:EAL domain-containing protein [Cellulomonas cellasea]|uniref:EAL domain-containing protein n=1 Tax=Cellulomonas cellasea TaxID=43670 RepID=UPI0025A43BE1|nr:EAL domain-containing protein [Cellulomonas cellasea]MDM8086573.1 EAL domain-containing protein [Cellulomonas cellasea]
MTTDEHTSAALAAAVDAAVPQRLRDEWARHVAREQVLVGRQGIFTPRLRPFGYEFSFRAPGSPDPATTPWTPLQHERATAHVLRATFGRSDLEHAAHGRWLFVRMPRGYLVGDLPIPARPDRLVIEIADSVDVDAAVVAGVRRLRERGYRVAIPGFISRPDQRLLLPHADFVKIDVRDLDVEGLPVVELARSYGALLIAEFVERHWMLSHSRELGFDLFQGNLLERSTVLDRSAARLARQAG